MDPRRPRSNLTFASATQGLRNLVGAFQDQRVVLYGDPYSTKKTLFRYNRAVRTRYIFVPL